MFYVYLDSPYGTELIGSATDQAEAERIKANTEAEWRKGYLWNIRITTTEEKEFSFYN